jgi:hypothetical protein
VTVTGTPAISSRSMRSRSSGVSLDGRAMR